MTKHNAKSDQSSQANNPRKPTVKSAPKIGAKANTRRTTKHPTNESSPGIDARNRPLSDWREQLLEQLRRLIHEAVPDIVEECKWVKPSNPSGVPVWSHAGIICTGESYKQFVKLTFARGAALPDPHKLFNSSLQGNTRRAIDIREGDVINAEAFKDLIRGAAQLNQQYKHTRAKAAPSAKSPSKTPKLLSGDNPQIAKGYGDAPVQAYIAAIPGWKQVIGQRLDELITRAIPHVNKAVKWNSPFYGIEGQGWFLSFHCFTKYMKVAFFQGALLKPLPPGESKQKKIRYLDVHEADQLDERQFTDWVKQASQLPGERI